MTVVREHACATYLIVRHTDGWELREQITGFRVKRDRFGDAMAEMHRQLIARRDELRARDDLSSTERQELDDLTAKFPDRFLRLGLAA